mgnify:FL=1
MSKKEKLNSNDLYALLGVVFLIVVITVGSVTYANRLSERINNQKEIQRLEKIKLKLQIEILEIQTKKITR